MEGISSPNNEIVMNNDGLRFRKKRKHKELDKENINDESKQEEELKSKTFKFSKQKETNLNLMAQNEIRKNNNDSLKLKNDVINKLIEDKNKINSKKSNFTKKDEEEVINEKLIINFQHDKNSINDNKMTLLKDLQLAKQLFAEHEEEYNKTIVNSIKSKLISSCIKTSKIRELIVPKISNDILLNQYRFTFSPSSSEINVELLLISLILDSRNIYKNYLLDNPNVGYIIASFYNEKNNFTILKSILNQLEEEIKNVQENPIIKIEESINTLNETKIKCLNEISNLIKNNYKMFNNIDQNIYRNNLISNEYENSIYNNLLNIFSSNNYNFKNIQLINFEEIKEFVSNNPQYLDYQIKNSELYKNIIINVFSFLILGSRKFK